MRHPTIRQLGTRDPGPHGETVQMIMRGRLADWRNIEPRETRPRDRSLPGKARIRARRQARQVANVILHIDTSGFRS